MANRTFGTLSGDHHLSCWLCRSQNITYIDTQSVLNIQYPWTPKTLSILKLCVNSMSNQFICDSDTMDPSFEEIAQEPQLTLNQNLHLKKSDSTVLSICQWISLSYLILISWRNYNIIPLDANFADSAQTEYCSTFHCSFVRHRRDISHFSHIWRHKCHVNHQGTHQTLYILNQNHLGYLSSKDQTRQNHLLHPDQPYHRFWL